MNKSAEYRSAEIEFDLQQYFVKKYETRLNSKRIDIELKFAEIERINEEIMKTVSNGKDRILNLTVKQRLDNKKKQIRKDIKELHKQLNMLAALTRVNKEEAIRLETALKDFEE